MPLPPSPPPLISSSFSLFDFEDDNNQNNSAPPTPIPIHSRRGRGRGRSISPATASGKGKGEEGEKEDPIRLEPYADSADGFYLLRPSSYLKVEKAEATALFVDRREKGNSIGIVVTPVKLSSLKEFGTPEFVADKLIQAERQKGICDCLFSSPGKKTR